MRIARAVLVSLLLNGLCPRLPAQTVSDVRKDIYHDGWTDLNKNGRKDVYEDPKADVGARVEDLLSQMTLEEKTCQMAT
ncbi:MAG: beta-glucosidase, partial [Acidobacteriota bacterium]|nr:beta-glucosidase [Acidobacteriota bacterium]